MRRRDTHLTCWRFLAHRFRAPGALLALALSVPSLALAQASAQPVCDIVSEADAVAVLGSVEKKQAIPGPDHCVFTTKDLSLTISRLSDQKPEQVKMLLQLPKQRALPGDVVKDEAGIGQGATSELSKGRAAMIAASGDTVWTFTVEHVYSRDLSGIVPKLRELARKIAGA